MPGVGAFPDAMKNLQDYDLIETLGNEVNKKGKPFLGICLGMQLLAKESSEVRPTKGLGWVDAEIKPFEKSRGLRVPHMGWDHIKILKQSPLFCDIKGEPTVYFVHSYNMHCTDRSVVAATCEYGEEFTAAICQNNILGTQFHPEKSQSNGIAIIDNFINWKI